MNSAQPVREIDRIVENRKSLKDYYQAGGKLSYGEFPERFRKQVLVRKVSQNEAIQSYSELTKMAHLNLQAYYRYHEEPDRIYFIFQFCHGISLKQYLDVSKIQREEWSRKGHRMLYLAVRVMSAVARAILFLFRKGIHDFHLSLDAVMLYLLGDVKLSDYCIKAADNRTLNLRVVDFMLEIFQSCLSHENFKESKSKLPKLLVLQAIRELLHRSTIPLERYLQDIIQFERQYRQLIEELYETIVMSQFMEEVDLISRVNQEGAPEQLLQQNSPPHQQSSQILAAHKPEDLLGFSFQQMSLMSSKPKQQQQQQFKKKPISQLDREKTFQSVATEGLKMQSQRIDKCFSTISPVPPQSQNVTSKTNPNPKLPP